MHELSNLGRKGFIWLTLAQHCSSLKEVRTGTQTGQEPEAGTDAEAMEECWLPGYSHDFVPTAFLQNPGPPACGGTTYNGLGPPPSITS